MARTKIASDARAVLSETTLSLGVGKTKRNVAALQLSIPVDANEFAPTSTSSGNVLFAYDARTLSLNPADYGLPADAEFIAQVTVYATAPEGFPAEVTRRGDAEKADRIARRQAQS